MADSINSKAKEYYDNDDSGGSLNNNLKDFLKQQGATGNSINTLWRSYAYGEGGNSLNTRLGKLWGTSGSLMKRWQDVLGLTWDEVKAFFNFRDTDPDFLLDGSTSFDGSNDYIDCGTGLGDALGDNYAGDLTVSMWFKADVTNGDDGMFEIGSFTNSSTGIFVFRLKANTISWITKWDRRIDVAYTNTSSWSHLVGVYDSRGADYTKLYLNGENIGTPAGTFPSASDIDLSGLKTTIGGYYGSPYTFDGKIANVGIWNRALSASEVESIYWRGSYSELKDTELTNLVSWYDLQGDVLDKQGSNNGTNNGATLNSDSYSGESPFKPRIQDIANPKMAVQLADGSTSFDGTDEYISFSDTGLPSGSSARTVAGWVYFDAINQNEVWFSYGTAGTNTGFFLGQYTDNKHNIGFYGNNYRSSSNAVANQWTHICAVFEGTSLKIYLNGSLDVDRTVTGTVNTTLNAGVIGNLIGNSTYHDGKIANVAIYSSALTQSQVQELMFTERYQNLSADLKTNLVSWYDLGDESLGSEKVSNGTFDTDTTGWTGVSGGNVTYDSANQRLINTPDSGFGSARQFLSGFTNGAKYKATWTQEEGLGLVLEGGATWDVNGLTYNYPTPSGQQDLNAYFNSSVTGNITLKFVVNGEVGYLDNMSIKQVFVPDSHGSNTGTPYGAISSSGYTSSPHGVVDPLNYGELYSGRALDFDGANDYVTTASISTFGITTSFTVSFWAKIDSYADWDSPLGATSSASLNDGFAFYIHSDTMKFFVNHYSDNVATFALSGIGSTEWNHYTGVYDGTNIHLYVNGLIGNSDTLSASVTNTSGIVNIGRMVSDTYNLNGKMSSVKIFNSALTQAQIRKLYTKPETVLPTGVSASNLKLDLPMQEGAGSYVYDGSGNQNHGEVFGATWATGQEYGYQASLVRSNTPMVFDGANDLVNLGNPIIDVWDNGGTISVWIYANSDGELDVGRVFNKRVGGEGWQLFVHNESGGNVDLRFYNEFSTTDGIWDITIPIKQWNHIVISYDNGSVSNNPVIYLNGTSQSVTEVRTPVGTRLTDAGQNLYVGNLSDGSVTFDGIINEVAIWDVALDADAVTALYGSGTPLLPTSDSGNYDNSGDLQGYWRNDGITTWTDRSTNSNNGTASGSPVSIVIPEGSTSGRDNQGFLLSDTTSISNGARFFSNEESIKIQDSEILQDIFDGGGSIDVWVYINSAGENGTGRIMDKRTSGAGWIFYTDFSIGNNVRFFQEFSTTDGRWDMAITTGQWNHLVVTYDNSSASNNPVMYLNGVSQTVSEVVTPVGTRLTDVGQDLYIGNRSDGTSTFDGKIDEVRIYKKVLSASEVTKNYNNGKSAHQ